MLIKEQLLPLVINALEERKAQDIKTLNVSTLSSVTDIIIIATGQSNRQVTAIADNVIDNAKKAGHRPLGDEGLDTGEWALVDLGDIVVHVMQPHIRDFYQLEKLWMPPATPVIQTS